MAVCIGCNEETAPVAFAVMHQRDFDRLELAPSLLGPGEYHASPVCQACYVQPSRRIRPLKAHFAKAGEVAAMLESAGSSSIG